MQITLAEAMESAAAYAELLRFSQAEYTDENCRCAYNSITPARVYIHM
jgi:hypothetical protein